MTELPHTIRTLAPEEVLARAKNVAEGMAHLSAEVVKASSARVDLFDKAAEFIGNSVVISAFTNNQHAALAVLGKVWDASVNGKPVGRGR